MFFWQAFFFSLKLGKQTETRTGNSRSTGQASAENDELRLGQGQLSKLVGIHGAVEEDQTDAGHGVRIGLCESKSRKRQMHDDRLDLKEIPSSDVSLHEVLERLVDLPELNDGERHLSARSDKYRKRLVSFDDEALTKPVGCCQDFDGLILGLVYVLFFVFRILLEDIWPRFVADLLAPSLASVLPSHGSFTRSAEDRVDHGALVTVVTLLRER
jgi:hypothetical protein